MKGIELGTVVVLPNDSLGVVEGFGECAGWLNIKVKGKPEEHMAKDLIVFENIKDNAIELYRNATRFAALDEAEKMFDKPTYSQLKNDVVEKNKRLVEVINLPVSKRKSGGIVRGNVMAVLGQIERDIKLN